MASIGMVPGATAAPGNTPTNATDKARVARAATEFEAVLLGQWLDGAERSFGTVPGSEEDEDAGGEQMRGFAMQQLAHTLAAKDTLGIAGLVQGGVEKAAAAGKATPGLPSAGSTPPIPAPPESALRAKLPPNL